MHPTKSRSRFTRFAKATSRVVGRPIAFISATGIVLVWIVSGPSFTSATPGSRDNTGTTIVTFLMVFLIQSSQNELIRASVPFGHHGVPGPCQDAGQHTEAPSTGRGAAQSVSPKATTSAAAATDRTMPAGRRFGRVSLRPKTAATATAAGVSA